MVGGILHRPLSIKNAKLMETHSPPIESLIERTEKYLKTGLELYRLKAIGKSADVFSSLVSKLAIISFFIFFFSSFKYRPCIMDRRLARKILFRVFYCCLFLRHSWDIYIYFPRSVD